MFPVYCFVFPFGNDDFSKSSENLLKNFQGCHVINLSKVQAEHIKSDIVHRVLAFDCTNV